MRTPPEQDIYVHLTGRDEERIGIPGRNDRMAMSKPNPETPVGYDFGQG